MNPFPPLRSAVVAILAGGWSLLATSAFAQTASPSCDPHGCPPDAAGFDGAPATGGCEPIHLTYRITDQQIKVPEVHWEQRTRELTKYRTETRTRKVMVTARVAETREVPFVYTESIPHVKSRVETFYENVPYTEKVAQEYAVMVPETRPLTLTSQVPVPVTCPVPQKYTVMVPEKVKKYQTYTVLKPVEKQIPQRYSIVVPEMHTKEVKYCVMVPQVRSVEQCYTTMVPELRVQTVCQTVCIPKVKPVTQSFTTLIPELQFKSQPYCVRIPEIVTDQVPTQIMVPETIVKKGYRTVCRMIPTLEEREVYVDEGEWKEEPGATFGLGGAYNPQDACDYGRIGSPMAGMGAGMGGCGPMPMGPCQPMCGPCQPRCERDRPCWLRGCLSRVYHKFTNVLGCDDDDECKRPRCDVRCFPVHCPKPGYYCPPAPECEPVGCLDGHCAQAPSYLPYGYPVRPELLQAEAKSDVQLVSGEEGRKEGRKEGRAEAGEDRDEEFRARDCHEFMGRVWVPKWVKKTARLPRMKTVSVKVPYCYPVQTYEPKTVVRTVRTLLFRYETRIRQVPVCTYRPVTRTRTIPVRYFESVRVSREVPVKVLVPKLCKKSVNVVVPVPQLKSRQVCFTVPKRITKTRLMTVKQLEAEHKVREIECVVYRPQIRTRVNYLTVHVLRPRKTTIYTTVMRPEHKTRLVDRTYYRAVEREREITWTEYEHVKREGERTVVTYRLVPQEKTIKETVEVPYKVTEEYWEPVIKTRILDAKVPTLVEQDLAPRPEGRAPRPAEDNGDENRKERKDEQKRERKEEQKKEQKDEPKKEPKQTKGQPGKPLRPFPVDALPIGPASAI